MKNSKKKTMPIGIKIAICVGIGVLTAVGVCTGFWLINRVTGYQEAKGFTENIIGSKETVEKFLDAKVGEDGMTDEDKKVYEDFVSAVDKTSECLDKLKDTGALKNETVNELYEKAKSDFAKLVKTKDIEAKLMGVLGDGELSEEDLATLKEMDNDYLTQLVDDITDYRNKVSEFNTKYENIKGVNKTVLDNDYAALVAAGDELSKKYSVIEMDSILGMSRDDILGFYGTIEELDNYLADKQ